MNTHAFEKKLHSLKARFGLQLFVLAAVVCTSWIDQLSREAETTGAALSGVPEAVAVMWSI